MNDEFFGSCRYFLTYSGIKLPFKLLTPLAPEQIQNRNTFFRGHFDERDRLIGLQKIVYGEIELAHRYAYDDHGGLRRAEITDADGEITVLNFTETSDPHDP